MERKMLILIVTVIVAFTLSACSGRSIEIEESDLNEINQEDVSEEVNLSDNIDDSVQATVDSMEGSVQATVDSMEGSVQSTVENKVVPSASEIIENHDYPIQISIGTEYSIDLNEDGNADTVSYMLDTIEPFQGNIISLKVNGVEYVDKLDELGFYMDTPNWKWYYIVDIDESDNFKEIAILDEGPSWDPETYFLRFDGNGLEYIGSIRDFPYESTFNFKGNGTIIARYQLAILQTWYAPGIWKLNENGHLQKVKEDLYYPYIYDTDTDQLAPILIQNFKLYKEPNLEAEQVVVGSGSKVVFKSTDNEHWVFLSIENRTEGWFYMENYSTILLDGEQVESASIFKNLDFSG